MSKSTYYGTFTASFVKLGARTVDIKLQRDEAAKLLGSLIRAVGALRYETDSFRISLKWNNLGLQKRKDQVSASIVP